MNDRSRSLLAILRRNGCAALERYRSDGAVAVAEYGVELVRRWLGVEALSARVERAARAADAWTLMSWIEQAAVDPKVMVSVILAPIETVWSPKTGFVRRRYGNWRSGDHRPDGLLLVRGPATAGRRALADVRMTDLGVTIGDLLGATLDDVDGRPDDGLRRALGRLPENAKDARKNAKNAKEL